MSNEKAIVGFIGAGGIARAHAYSLNSLRYFYNDSPEIDLRIVCAATEASRTRFAKQFGFTGSGDIEDLMSDDSINTIFILGPNKAHYDHLEKVIGKTGLQKVYIEKPVCANHEEEKKIAELINDHPGITIQVGFQFLFSSAIMEMLKYWRSGIPGKALHFDLKYYHGDYLRKEYRESRQSRLTAAPDGGAMADLGSHSLSMLTAFLGDRLRIMGALQGGHFQDVREDSDLFSLISIYDEVSGAVGTVSASRISSGTGDSFLLELYAQEGALRYSSLAPDIFEFYNEKDAKWTRRIAASNYKPASSFPSSHVPGGWLRPMIHAHYVFFKGNVNGEFVPGIEHGLSVQRLVSQTAEHLTAFRESLKKR